MTGKKITWKNEKRKLSALIPAAYNPRRWNDEAIKQLTQSIEKFDLADPLIINTNNTIIGGHFRYKILKDKGIIEAEVRVPDRLLDEAEEKELNIRLNKNLGEFDFDLLADFGEDLLKDIGFDSKELDKIFQLETKPEDDDVPPVPEEPTAKIGEIYQLGRHRVMCGDSAKIEDVERLMDGKKADMVFTDPPYNVDYEGYTDDELKIKNDHKSVDAFIEDLKAWFLSCVAGVKKTASLYVCHPSLFQREFQNTLEEAGLEIRCQIVWVKNTFAWGFGRYKFQHEPIFYCHVKGEKDDWYGDRTQSTTWNIDKPSANRLHPTMKPVELVTIAISNSSQRENIILDLFMGGGSTLIACEKTSRICYGMEIDPKYVDVIIKRWEDFTGQKAAKLSEN